MRQVTGMKIVLAALNAKYVHSNLAVYDLKAYADKQLMAAYDGSLMPQIVIKEYTINHNLDQILQSLYQEKAAVVAFSCYIWNIHEILTIAKELHKVAPAIRIWLGGPEVSFDSDKLMQENPFVEGIIQGEGEITFYEMTGVWAENGDLSDVKGIIYRDRDGCLHQNLPRPIMSLNEVPFIYQDLDEFKNKILYYETSRGCPFSCSYCLSSIDKRVRFRSMEMVESELRFFLEHKVPQVKFIDRTFNCKREHSLAIWRYITEHDNGVTNFHFEISADLLGEEELEVFRTMRPGLIQLEIGLQSTHPATVKEIHRTMNIGKVKKNMLAVHAMHNIHQHLDLIAGLPYEDFVTFQKSFNEAYAMKPDQLQLGFLKVLKGSYMEEQVEEYGLQYQDYQPYEVLCTKWITYDEILALKKVEEMVEVYYNSDQFAHTLPYLLSFFDSPFMFYQTLGNYYEAKDLFGIGFKREARYEALRQFVIEWFKKSDGNAGKARGASDITDSGNTAERTGDEEEQRKRMKGLSMQVLDDLLAYDYYLRENAKSRPSWRSGDAVDKAIYHQFFKNGGTDEITLAKEGYDSKVAARMMHIEPLSGAAVKWILADGMDAYVESAVALFAEDTTYYCLFDYDERNPLSKDARVKILTHL